MYRISSRNADHVAATFALGKTRYSFEVLVGRAASSRQTSSKFEREMGGYN
jgi:hypothetical protein